jgi:hypothetical protein
MATLCEEIKKIEPKIDLSHEIAGCGLFKDIIETPDGYFLGMRKGDIGYNVFLGKPSNIAKKRTARIFKKLSTKNKIAFIYAMRRKQIRPKDVGIVPSKKKKALFQVI